MKVSALAAIALLVSTATAEAERGGGNGLSQLTFDRSIPADAKQETTLFKKRAAEKKTFTHRFMTARKPARRNDNPVAHLDAYSVHDLTSAPEEAVESTELVSKPVTYTVKNDAQPTVLYNQSQWLDTLPHILRTETPKYAVTPWEIMRNSANTRRTAHVVTRRHREGGAEPSQHRGRPVR